tara:strand:+ start:272 stop:538 length:267 start_codon:yes stop_codon:yes gene_type:complete
MSRQSKTLFTDQGAKIIIKKNFSGSEIVVHRLEKDAELSELLGADHYDVCNAEIILRIPTAGRYAPTLKETVELVEHKIKTVNGWKYH